jgi:tRNA threonylcarbamoyladenosine biosynthesis protein TsaB
MTGWGEGACLLAVDTCGSAGSVALGRVEGGAVRISGEGAIPGGEFAAQLLPVIEELLTAAGLRIGELGGITVVTGPGSFTGIRIGLAAVKAMAEAAALPVVTVSRLALLADLAQAASAVLDAHRGQVFYGHFGPDEEERELPEDRELLLTAGEINAMGGLSGRVAVCEESVAQMIEELQGEPELVRVAAPTAADALRFSAASWQAGKTADVATLDGHYLRGADAKIAEPKPAGRRA